MIEANYALMERLMSQWGVREYAGPEVNSLEILSYFVKIGHPWVKTDETAWCSAFINWGCEMEGIERSGKLDARSWLKAGIKVPIDQARLGDIVVLWRESLNSWKGHVGLNMTFRAGNVELLGGNQNNCVCIMGYPQSRILGVRRLRFLKDLHK